MTLPSGGGVLRPDQIPHMRTPPIPGLVYRHFDPDGVLLYVGSTDIKSVRLRQIAHMRGARWWRYIETLHFDQYPDRESASAAEDRAIATEMPIFNRAGVSPSEQRAREATYIRSRERVREPRVNESAGDAGVVELRPVLVPDLPSPPAKPTVRAKRVGTKEAAEALGLNRCTLQRMVQRGLIRPHLRTPGGHMRWDLARLHDELRVFPNHQLEESD